jgi:hypothetical protein
MISTQAPDFELACTIATESMETVRRFFDRLPQFTQLAKAVAEFAREDFHQPLEPRNFLAFVERDAGDLDEESMLEYCRMHLEFANLWNLGLELEVRSCWRMSSVLDHWRGLIQGVPRSLAA